MGAQEVSLSLTDAAALADGFRPLEPYIAGLPDRLVRYVIEGHDEGVLLELATLPDAASLLGMDLSWGGLAPPSRKVPLPAWDVLLQHPAEVPIPVLLRFAKVLSTVLGPRNLIAHSTGHAVVYQSLSSLQPLSPPSWLELLVRLGARPGPSGNIFPLHKNRLSAEIIERMLVADGHSPEILYQKTFPTMRYDPISLPVVSLLGGLAGFGERIAKRPDIVRAALQASSAVRRALAIQTFEKLSIPADPFLDDLAGLATGPAKSLREAASTLLVRAAASALPTLRSIAETGKPPERCHALSLIARLDLPEGREFLRARAEVEKTASVRKLLSELAGMAVVAMDAPPTALAEIDIFAGVALDHASRAALAAWAKGVSQQDLDQAFAWLIDPAPWMGDPPTVLKEPAQAGIEELKRLLARPELTPLHAVRLLRLAGLLQVSPNVTLKRLLDFSIPRRRLRAADGGLSRYPSAANELADAGSRVSRISA